MNPIWFVRMARWARHPPSWGRVKLVAVVVLLCATVYGVELLWGWPEWLTVNGRARLPRP